MKTISSRANPLVALFRAAARGLRPPDAMLLDGEHLVAEALRAKVRIVRAALTEHALELAPVAALAEALSRAGAEPVLVTESLMEALSPVRSPSGIVALAERPGTALAEAFAGRPFVVAGSDVQDPGNVGALVRAAEAGGATAAILAGASADPLGWKALRGSMGSAFRLRLGVARDLDEVLASARRAGARVVAAVPRDGRSMYDADLTGDLVLLLGGEGPGLPARVIAEADDRVTIPMHPPVESLNVAVAAALLVYEAARQRRRG